jgi:hypothetical protein
MVGSETARLLGANSLPAHQEPSRNLAGKRLGTKEGGATAAWCKLAGSEPRCCDRAIKHLVRPRFGAKVAAPGPSDTEAMKAFPAQGATLVAGLSKGEWANVRRAGAARPAGPIGPTAKPYSLDPNAKPVDVIPEGE